MVKVLVNTVIYGAGALFLSLTLGAIIAFLVERTDIPFRSAIYTAMLVSLAVPTMWLFQNEAGQPMDDSKVRKVFARLFIKAGLTRRNLHFLRHTFASLLIQQGESLVYVKEQMGHSSIDVTVDTYGHLVPGGNRQAVDKLDDGFEDSDQLGMETKWNHFGQNESPEEKTALQVIEKTGATRRNRTGDLLITNQLLYQLS